MTPEEKRAKRAAYMREWTARNKDKVNAQRRERRTPETLQREKAWRAANPEKCKEYDARYNAANPEKVRAWKRKWERENREAKNARQRERYAADPESARTYCRMKRTIKIALYRANEARYREKRREELRSYSLKYFHSTKQQRRVRLLQYGSKSRAKEFTIPIVDVDFEAIVSRDGWVCQICSQPISPEELSFDHCVPLSKGGAHVSENIQACHLRCNKSKGARVMPLQPPV